MSFQRLTRNKHEGPGSSWGWSFDYEDFDFGHFLGRTITQVHVLDDHEAVLLIEDNGAGYLMAHKQDCCENVYLEDIEGDLEDLLDSPVIQAEEVYSGDNREWRSNTDETDTRFKLEQAIGALPPPPGPLCEHEESFTWTFYRISTSKGGVVLRWYGSSNGYYGERVDVVRLLPAQVAETYPWALPPRNAEPVHRTDSLLSSVSRSSHER